MFVSFLFTAEVVIPLAPLDQVGGSKEKPRLITS